MSKQLTGSELIANERQRQTEKEGWTPEHDDGHCNGEMALAACCYAAPSRLYGLYKHASGFNFGDAWPWDLRWDKRVFHGNVVVRNDQLILSKRIDLLVKAGALIAAEIDRLQRKQEYSGEAEAKKEQGNG